MKVTQKLIMLHLIFSLECYSPSLVMFSIIIYDFCESGRLYYPFQAKKMEKLGQFATWLVTGGSEIRPQHFNLPAHSSAVPILDT